VSRVHKHTVHGHGKKEKPLPLTLLPVTGQSSYRGMEDSRFGT